MSLHEQHEESRNYVEVTEDFRILKKGMKREALS